MDLQSRTYQPFTHRASWKQCVYKQLSKAPTRRRTLAQVSCNFTSAFDNNQPQQQRSAQAAIKQGASYLKKLCTLGAAAALFLVAARNATAASAQSQNLIVNRGAPQTFCFTTSKAAPQETDDSRDSPRSRLSTLQPNEHKSSSSHFDPVLTPVMVASVSQGTGINRMFDKAIDKTSLVLQRVLAAGVVARVFLLFSLGFPFVLIFGFLYYYAAGCTLKEAIIKVYSILYNVSFDPADEPNRKALLVTNTVFLFGIFVFALIIGGINEEIKTAVDNARAGRFPLHQTNHVLVLNWNKQTVQLLKHIAEGGNNYSGLNWRAPVVVLADKPKEEMDEALNEGGLPGYDLEYYTRQGDPHILEDLYNVGAPDAKMVIVMQPEGQSPETAEAYKTATAVALAAAGLYTKDIDVFVQAQNDLPRDSEIVRSFAEMYSGKSPATTHLLQLPDNKIMYRYMSCTAAQPGLIHVWLSILQPGAPERVGLAFPPLPASLQGLTYREVRQRYSTNAAAWGYVSGATGKLCLCPPDDTILTSIDKMVVLCRGGQTSPASSIPAAFKTAPAAARTRMGALRKRSEVQPQRIIVAGWREDDLDDLMEGLSSFTPPGSTITFVLTRKPEVPLKSSGPVRLHHQVADQPTSTAALAAAGIRHANAVIIGGLDELGDKEADARVLAGLVQIHAACVASGRSDPVHVVSAVRNTSTSEVAAKYLEALAASSGSGGGLMGSPELVQLEDIVSALLAQVAYQPEYKLVIEELLVGREGHEIYLRQPSAFNMAPGESVTFAEVSEAAQLVGEVALGWIDAGSAMSLVPPPQERRTVAIGDRVITLAADFEMKRVRDL